MKRILSIISAVLVIISVFCGCADSYIQPAATTAVPTTTTTTTQPTTQIAEVDRGTLLEGNPTGQAKMDSVGGIDVNIEEKYIGTKTVKYYTYTVSLYNDVGDPVKDEIKGRNEIVVKVTGPLYPDEELLIFGNPLCYASTCGEIHIDEMEFEYMDGTKEKIWFGYSWKVQY